MANISVNADAQRVRAAARPTLSGRRLLQRYVAAAALAGTGEAARSATLTHKENA